MQQDQFGVGRKSRVQLGDSALSIVGFARDQQAMNRLRAARRFTDYRVSLFHTLLDQGQPLAGSIVGQARFIAQDQPDGHPRTCQPRGPEGAQAASAKNMPGVDISVYSIRSPAVNGAKEPL